MAKGLQLVDTNLMSVSISIIEPGRANVYRKGAIIDDNGEVIKEAEKLTEFSDLPTNIKAAANNFMRLLSQEFNNEQVNENKVTWSDL